jgi:hypothetical protein
MKKQMKNLIIPEEVIENRIFMIRRKKIMLDRDLAKLYGVETGNLNKAVKRNNERFPADFVFQLTKEELQSLLFQFGRANRGGSRTLPYAFTEQGVAMLSSVLKSKQAIRVNIQIMRTFTKIREMIVSNKALREKIESMERKHDSKFKVVFDVIKRLIEKDKIESTKIVGFRDRKKSKKT